MYISNYKYRIAELTKEHIEASAVLLAEMFNNHNKVWGSMKHSLQEMQEFMRARTLQLLEWQQDARDQGIIPKNAFINYVYLDEQNQVVGVATHAQLTMYLSRASKVQLQGVTSMFQATRHLENSIKPADKQPGLSLYGLVTAIKPELIGSGLALVMFLDGGHVLHAQGFRVFYTRFSNPRNLALAKKDGAIATAKTEVTINGEKLEVVFGRWEMAPISTKNKLLKVFLGKASL